MGDMADDLELWEMRQEMGPLVFDDEHWPTHWRMRNGALIALVDMETSHLQNVLNAYYRAGIKTGATVCAFRRELWHRSPKSQGFAMWTERKRAQEKQDARWGKKAAEAQNAPLVLPGWLPGYQDDEDSLQHEAQEERFLGLDWEIER
jgi:hypothetical protein